MLKIMSRGVFRRVQVLIAVLIVSLASISVVLAQSVKVGRTVGGSGFHIPSYVAIDKGF